ncbi:matrix metallopeptidase 23B, partial [Homo sapiens]
TTRTAWSPRCTTASTAPRGSWPTPSSPRTAASTSTTASTGSWAPRATAGRKVTVQAGLLEASPLQHSGLPRSGFGADGRRDLPGWWLPLESSRRVAHGPGARGGPRDRPRAGPDALTTRPGAHAPERHAARLEGVVPGRAVGAAPALRMPRQAVRVRVLGAEGLLRRSPAAHEEALPQQLRLLLRIPLPHGGHHPTAPQDQNQAGARGQERDLPLRPEDPPQERESVLVQGPGAPGVLLPRLPGPGRGAPEHHRQRRQ